MFVERLFIGKLLVTHITGKLFRDHVGDTFVAGEILLGVEDLVALVAWLSLLDVGVGPLLVLVDSNLEAEDLVTLEAGIHLGVGLLGDQLFVAAKIGRRRELHVALVALEAHLLVHGELVVLKGLLLGVALVAEVALVAHALMLALDVFDEAGVVAGCVEALVAMQLAALVLDGNVLAQIGAGGERRLAVIAEEGLCRLLLYRLDVLVLDLVVEDQGALVVGREGTLVAEISDSLVHRLDVVLQPVRQDGREVALLALVGRLGMYHLDMLVKAGLVDKHLVAHVALDAHTTMNRVHVHVERAFALADIIALAAREVVGLDAMLRRPVLGQVGRRGADILAEVARQRFPGQLFPLLLLGHGWIVAGALEQPFLALFL